VVGVHGAAVWKEDKVLSERARKLLENSPWTCSPRDATEIAQALRSAGLPVEPPVVQFQVDFGGLELVSATAGRWAFEVMYYTDDGAIEVYESWERCGATFFSCLMEETDQFRYYLDPAGRIFYEENPVAESAATWIESFALEDELRASAEWRGRRLGFVSRDDRRFETGLPLAPIREASDGLVKWWEGPHLRVGRCGYELTEGYDFVQAWYRTPEGEQELAEFERLLTRESVILNEWPR
jgi:hypothetical protein